MITDVSISLEVLILVIVDYSGSAWFSVFCENMFSFARELMLLKLRQL